MPCSADGRSLGRAIGRCTVTWLPNFLGWVDYFIFLPMVLRARDLRYKATIKHIYASGYKRRFEVTMKMDRHNTWNVNVTVRWFSNIGLSVTGCLRIFKLRLCDKICTCLTSYLAKWNFLFVFLFLLGCAESLSIPDKLYATPRLFHKYLGDKRKTNNQQHKNALIFHVSSVALMVCKKGKNRSWSFCKTWRPMTCSSKKWTLISNRTAEEKRQQTLCVKSDNQ